MKLILLDYFRRWWWVWVIMLLADGGMAWGACVSSNHDIKSSFFPFGFFVGSLLLSIDLQKGCTRAILSLPITPRQLGRIWWWAAVGLPILAITVTSSLVYLGTIIFNGNHASLSEVVRHVLINAVILGAGFFSLTGLPSRQAQNQTIPDKVRGAIFGTLWGLSMGGWFFLYKFVTTETLTGKVIIGIGAILLVWGWFRAESMVWQRAGFRLASQGRSPSGKISRCAEGSGGLGFLMRQIFFLMGRTGFLFVTFYLIILWWMSIHTLNDFVTSMITRQMFVMLTLMMGLQVLPVCFHLRFLRTLPISTAGMSGVLIFTPVVAILTVFAYTISLLSLFLGQSWPKVIESCVPGLAMQLGLLTLLIPLLVWRGWNAYTFLVFFGAIMGFMLVPIFTKFEIPHLVSYGVSVVLILAGFILTKWILERSSYAYRPQNIVPSSPWGGCGSQS